MKTNRILWLFGLALFSSAAPATSHADFVTLLSSKQWENSEETDPLLNTPVCRAYTRKSDSAEPVELGLAYPKDGLSLPMITLRTRLSAPTVTLKLSRKESAALFLLQASSSETDANVYWYAPVNFAELEQFIRAKSELEIYFGASLVKASLSGSANAVGAAKKCLGAVKVPTDFFKLLNGEKKNLTPDLGERNARTMWLATDEAFRAFGAGKGIEAALATLRKPFAPILKKEAYAQKTYNENFASHGRATQRLVDARQKVTDIQLSIATAKTDLAALEQEKPLAETDLAAKKATYLPLKEQMKPYEAKVEEVARSLRQTNAEIEKNENTIRRGERSIRNLEVERRNLTQRLPGLESDASQYRRAYSEADSEYRRYDTNRERDRILDNNSSYRWARDDLERGQRELRDAEGDQRQASGDVNRYQSELSRCRSQPDANCSSIESELSRAQSRENDAERRVNSARSQISSAEWTMRNAESSADSQARNEESRLRSIRDDFASRLQSVESELQQTRGRIASINDEIPALRSQIRRAQNALPGLRQEVVELTQELERVTAARENFSREIGFGVAEQAYRSAETHLAEVVKGISARKKEIPVLEKNLVRAQRDIPSLEKSETRARAERDKSDAALKAIQAQLEPLRAQESKLLANLARESERFDLNQAVYQDLYKYLVESGG